MRLCVIEKEKINLFKVDFQSVKRVVVNLTGV